MTPERVLERVRQMAANASDLGAPSVDLGHSAAGPGAAGELAKIAGARMRAHVHQPEGEGPIVIESVEVEFWGVPVRAQWERPLSPDERSDFEQQVANRKVRIHASKPFACASVTSSARPRQEALALVAGPREEVEA